MSSATILALFAMAEMEHGIPDKLLTAMCWEESRHRPKVINMHDGVGHSRGICQLKLGTAKGLGFRGRPSDLYNPIVNISYAAKLLRLHYDKYQSWDKAVVAYNAGRYIGKTVYLTKVKKTWCRFNKRECQRERVPEAG